LSKYQSFAIERFNYAAPWIPPGNPLTEFSPPPPDFPHPRITHSLLPPINYDCSLRTCHLMFNGPRLPWNRYRKDWYVTASYSERTHICNLRSVELKNFDSWDILKFNCNEYSFSFKNVPNQLNQITIISQKSSLRNLILHHVQSLKMERSQLWIFREI
jgi:hypothetical protein